MSDISPRRDIPQLTGLRAVAAFAVVLCHLSAAMQTGTIKSLLGQGWIAVDLFFILSGYILAHTYPEPVYREFILKRIARIYPVHLFTFIVTFGVFLFYLGSDVHLAAGGPGTVYEFFRHLTLTQAWFGYRSGLWNGVSWSLSAEWFVYLCFPLLLWLSRKPKPWIALVGLMVLYLILSNTFAHTNNVLMFKTAIPRVTFCFLMGLMAYRTKINGAWADLITVAIPFLGLILTSHHLWAWYYAPLLLVWIMALGSGTSVTARLLSLPVMVWLGEISYSLYMVHGPILEVFKHYLPQSPQIMLEELLTMLLVAALTYEFVEVPARKYILTRYGDKLPSPHEKRP